MEQVRRSPHFLKRKIVKILGDETQQLNKQHMAYGTGNILLIHVLEIVQEFLLELVMKPLASTVCTPL